LARIAETKGCSIFRGAPFLRNPKPIKEVVMKTVITFFSILFLLAVGSAVAHHPPADILDEEIYAIIDSMVENTPHAELDFDDTMTGMVEPP
jgi:hypothetical protein